ncbi:hypothetical protein QE152_g30896 [Popillia japonica]|uniref:Uncharacterized protein n=1 Tax=Popillia japonica TaxID=7064 RepID=A0AAW1JDC1_POPJA
MIIMDNASYLSELRNKPPDASWRKGNIQGWLANNNIAHDTSMLKHQLLHLVALHKPPKEYVIDELARAHGHTVSVVDAPDKKIYKYACIVQAVYEDGDVEVMALKSINKSKTKFYQDKNDVSFIKISQIVEVLPAPLIAKSTDEMRYEFLKPINTDG